MKTSSSPIKGDKPKKGEKKPNSKLSLQKKSKASKTERKERIRSVASAGLIDLNETCEFKDGLSMRGSSSGTMGSTWKASISDGLTKEENREENLSDVEVTCEVCKKNLSHMSSQRRLQHVNRCIDKLEETVKKERSEKQALEKAKTAVLNCPMCGQTLNTEQARLSHLKKCSQQLSVTTETMLKLVKEQEEERQTLLAAGVIPDSVKSNIKLTEPGKKQGKRKPAKEPKSKLEEDVQLAMAISSSMSDQGSGNKHELMEGLGQAGAATRDKKSKRKKHVEEVFELTSLSDADRQRRLADKVMQVLGTDEDSNGSSEGTMELFCSNFLSLNKDTALWDRSVTDTGSEIESFYVKALIPPIQISGPLAGRKFNRLLSIPGREQSFIQEEQKKEIVGEDIFTASTQTAVVLAELAVDTDETATQSPTDLNATGFLPVEEVLTLQQDDEMKARENVLESFRSLVNNPEYSDVQLITSDGKKLFAHKNILSLRCPQLIKEDMSDQLNLELTVKSALALLTYLYTGELTLTASFQAELIKFSEQFAVPELLALCHKLQPAADKEFDKSDDSAQEMEVDEDMNKTKLGVMLKEIWGESDSDSDHSEVFNDSTGDRTGKQDHDLRSSQKQRLEIEKMKENVQNTERIDQILNDKSASNMTDLSETDSFQESDYKHKNNNLIVSNTCLIDDNDVKIDDLKYSNYENEVTSPNHVIGDGSPQPKRQKTNCSPDCDISNISEKNVLKDTSKDITKELAYCGVSFDSSFTRLRPSPNEKSDENVIVGSQLDSSSADLFESPSPKLSQKPLFKPTEKETWNDVKSQNNKLESSPTKASKNKSPRIDDIVMKETGSVKDDSIVIDDDDDDLEITGDNFAELSQPSPTFGDTKCKNSVFSKTSVSASACNAEALKMSDKYTEKKYTGAVNEEKIKDLDSHELHEKSISEKHGDDINSDIADLHNFSFNDSFNEHFDSGEQNRSVSDVLNLSSCDKNIDKNSGKSVAVISDNVDKGDGLRKHSSIEALEIDSDHSDTAQELGSKMKLDEYEKKSPQKTDTKCSEVGSEASNSQNDLSGAGFDDDGVSESVKEKQGKHSQDSFSEGDNIWEDFEDCGVGFPDIVPSPADSQPNKAGIEAEDLDNAGELDDENSNDKIVALLEEAVEQDDNNSNNHDDWPVVDSPVVGESGAINNCNLLSVKEPACSKKKVQTKPGSKVTSFKTPTEGHQGKKRVWVPPSPFTPMPNYDNMNTPVLKKEVQRFGVKPVGKKRMVKVLKDIYQQTHKYETDSEFEDEKVDDVTKATTAITKTTTSVTKATVAVSKSSNAVTKTTTAVTKSTAAVSKTTAGVTKSTAAVSKTTAGVTKPTTAVSKTTTIFRDPFEFDIPGSQADISSSQESDVSDLLEETCIHPPSDDSDVTNSPQKGVNLTKQLTDYIQGNQQLKIRMLMYEPIELDVLKKDMKEAGIKCGMDKLMEFLDERCLAFTTKNARKRAPTKRGRKKKTTAADKS